MTEFYTKAVAELKNIYDNLNRDYYEGKLPEVVITIQSSPKGKAYGWYAKDRWGIETDKEKAFDEINISAEYLSRPIENIVSTLQHEMVHLYCAMNDIKDTSNNNVYHNKKFKEEAEQRGLSIEKAQTIGWSVTTPTEEFIKYIKGLSVDEDAFKFFRKMPLGKEKTKKTAKKTTKYTCPCCEVSVRGEPDLEIECKKCGVLMESKH